MVLRELRQCDPRVEGDGDALGCEGGLVSSDSTCKSVLDGID